MDVKALKDAVSIAEAIKESDFDRQSPILSAEFAYWDKYINPMLSDFKNAYAINPSNIIRDFLENYLLFNRHRLNDIYRVNSIPFNKNRLKEYCWSCIFEYNKDKGRESYKFSPQLTLTITNEGVVSGFSYGKKVENDSPFVSIFQENKKMKKFLLEYFPDYEIYNRQKGSTEIRKTILEYNPTELFSQWNRDLQVIKVIPKKKITTMITKELVDSFDKLIQLFILCYEQQ